MTELELVEARRRVPSLTDRQWLAWLQHVQARSGSLVLPIGDGCPFAEYPRLDAPQTSKRVSNDQPRPSAAGDAT